MSGRSGAGRNTAECSGIVTATKVKRAYVRRMPRSPAEVAAANRRRARLAHLAAGLVREAGLSGEPCKCNGYVTVT